MAGAAAVRERPWGGTARVGGGVAAPGAAAGARVAARPPAAALDAALPGEPVAWWAMAAWRAAAAVAVVAPFALAPAVAAGADADWVRLMRGMALTKLALALPIVAAADWRVRRAGACAVRVGWVAAALVAAAGPGWIWGLRGIGAASAAFHAALVAAVALLALDARRVAARAG